MFNFWFSYFGKALINTNFEIGTLQNLKLSHKVDNIPDYPLKLYCVESKAFHALLEKRYRRNANTILSSPGSKRTRHASPLSPINSYSNTETNY